jgi:hypothetical protein
VELHALAQRDGVAALAVGDGVALGRRLEDPTLARRVLRGRGRAHDDEGGHDEETGCILVEDRTFMEQV